MGETAKILSPDKKVIMPNLAANVLLIWVAKLSPLKVLF